jgi:hypothetical protein
MTFFCGAKYPKPPGSTAPEFNNEYVAYMKWSQAKSIMVFPLAMDVMRQNVRISVKSSKFRVR